MKESEITYRLVSLATRNSIAEKPIAMGDKVIWLLARPRRADTTWLGLKALSDAPNNREAVIETWAAAEFARKITPSLPKGWAVEAKENVVTVRRLEKVEVVWLPISSPAHAQDRHDMEEFSIAVAFGPALTQEQVNQMTEANHRREARMEELRYKLRHLTHKADDWIPESAEDKALIAEFGRLKDSLQRIPDGFATKFSIIIRGSLIGGYPRWQNVQPDAVRRECSKVLNLVKSSFSRTPERPLSGSRP